MNKLKQILPYIGVSLGGVAILLVIIFGIIEVIKKFPVMPISQWILPFFCAFGIIGFWMFFIWSINKLGNK